MTARNLLAQLREKGIEIKTSGADRLVIDAPKGAITPELRSALSAHKVELLQILNSEQQPPSQMAPCPSSLLPWRIQRLLRRTSPSSSMTLHRRRSMQR